MLVSAELNGTVIHMSVFRKWWLSHSHTITVSPLSLLQPVPTTAWSVALTLVCSHPSVPTSLVPYRSRGGGSCPVCEGKVCVT